MSVQSDCPSCANGVHDNHDVDHGITPGLIGGTYCGCIGDCPERFEITKRAIVDVFASFGLRAVKQCPRISPESGSECLLADNKKAHYMGHDGQDKGTRVGWGTDLFDRLRWERADEIAKRS